MNSKNSPSYLSFSPDDIPMEDPRTMARSVVAGCLLQRHYNMPFFSPINSEVLLDYLKEDYLISSIEKDYLLRVGGDNPSSCDEGMITGIGAVLLLLEETGAISCELLRNLNGKGKSRVEVRSLRPHLLKPEILPRPPLMLQDLAVSIDDILQEQKRKEDMYRLLSEPSYWCPPPPSTKPTIGGVRTAARVSRCRCIRRVRPRINKVETILQHIAHQRCHAHVNAPFSEASAAPHPIPQVAGLFATSEAPPGVSTAPQTSSSSSSPSSLSATSLSTPAGSAVASGSSPGNSSVH